MPEFYRRADRLVHASLYESQGMAILEALATGLGVIATDVGIAAELPRPLVFGWQPRDHDALARAIVRSCRGTEHAAAALSDGPALVAGRYSVPVARAAFETIYDGLITGR
jgi:glycosyltransferase involved in cell wall biosynthesis